MSRLYSISGTEFINSLVADEPCGPTPSDPRHPKGEWCCDGPVCPVRELVIESMYYGDDVPEAPPTMRCPACGDPLRFVSYLEEVRLVPASASLAPTC